MAKSLSEVFKALRAPLANTRWSWGSTGQNGAVFLRVWEDRKTRVDGKIFMMVTHHEKYCDNPDNLGYRERLRHVELVRSGAPCYLIMCVAEDATASPRKIKSFNDREVFVGGELADIEGNAWVELAGRTLIADLVAQTTK